MRWSGVPRKAYLRVRVGRRASVPGVPSLTDPAEPTPARPTEVSGQPGEIDRPPLIDRSAVQYLDRARAIFRPTRRDSLTPGLERFIGQEDVFRHVGVAEMGSGVAQAMMQCPVHWHTVVQWVPIDDLEILEILEDQDVRAG